MVIRRLLNYLKPHYKALSVASIILLVATFADVVGPILVKIFLDRHLMPRSFESRDLVLLGGGYLGLHILSVGLHYYQLVSFNQIALKVIQQLRANRLRKNAQGAYNDCDCSSPFYDPRC